MADVQAQIQQAAAKNAELLRVIAETDYAVPALQEQDRFLADMGQQLAQSDKNLKTLDRKREAELKDHEKYRDSHMKRFVFKAAGKKEKFAQRAEKEEREYFDVLQQQHQEKNLNDNLRAQIDEATKAQRELQDTVKRHDNMQRELDQLYHAIFSGPTPQFPDEDSKEHASSLALQAYQDTKRQAEAESHVVQLLSQAMGEMNGAIRNMDEALHASRMDMFGGGAMADMMERSSLSQAERMLQQARMKHLNAKHANPMVGDLPPVNINHGSLMSDVFFDNIFTDMAFHDQIKNGRAEVVRCAGTLNNQLEQSKHRLSDVQQQLHQRESDLDVARKALQKARELAFENVTKGGGVPLAAPVQTGEKSEVPPAYQP